MPVGELTLPVGVAAPPNDPRLFVIEQDGRIQVLDANGTLAPQPFLDISDELIGGGERGLLGLAFAPDYATSGRFYVYVTAEEPAGRIEIREYRVGADPNRADRATKRLVLEVDHAAHPNHNGGALRFGPDGKLYAGIGDGGGSNNPEEGPDGLRTGQSLQTLLGKLIRIDPLGPVPADNPFASTGNGVRPEIWQYGLRNPWRFSFDRATGDLLIGDVGQDLREEIDYAPGNSLPGANWGWPCFEGSLRNVDVPDCEAPGARGPVHERDHNTDPGVYAITGGVVVRDPGVPSLAGRYVYTDAALDRLHSLVPSEGTASERAEDSLRANEIVSIDEDGCGRVVLTSYAGTISRLVDGTPSVCPAPAAPGGPPMPPPAEPAAPTCGVTVDVRRRHSLRDVRRRGVAVGLRSLARCAVTGRLRLPRGGYGPERSTDLLPGARRRLRLRATRADRRRLARRVGRSGQAKVTVRLLLLADGARSAVLRRVSVRVVR